MKKKSNRAIFHNIYKEFYSKDKETGNFEQCDICKDATCERSDDEVLFLPYESQFIFQNIDNDKVFINSKTLKEVETTEQDCPYFKEKRCKIHSHRPIDCRSFPLVPLFHKGKFILKISSSFPYGHKITQDFYDSTNEIWTKLSPVLSDNWKQRYRKMISSIEFIELPSHINT